MPTTQHGGPKIMANLEIGDTFILPSKFENCQRFVYLGDGKARHEIRTYQDRKWEVSRESIDLPAAAIAKWEASKA